MVGEGNKIEAKGAVLSSELNRQIHISVIPFAAHLVHSQQPDVRRVY